jgi:hypothetical protein
MGLQSRLSIGFFLPEIREFRPFSVLFLRLPTYSTTEPLLLQTCILVNKSTTQFDKGF